jgi:hypothetical protein
MVINIRVPLKKRVISWLAEKVHFVEKISTPWS